MLKNLFISKVRIRVLEQFFLNPQETYHVRGLVRVLDEEINAIRRELMNLEECGILRSEKQTNKIVFSLNIENPFYDELRGMVLKDSTLGRKIAKVTKECGKPDVVVLSSSFFTKEYLDPSDVDFLFIGQFDIRKLGAAMKELEGEYGKEFRYTAITMQDFEFGKKKRASFIVNVIERDFVVIFGSAKRLMI